MKVILVDTFLLGDKVYTAALATALIKDGYKVEVIIPSGMAGLVRILCPDCICLELPAVPWIQAGWFRNPSNLVQFWKEFEPMRDHAVGSIGINVRGGLLQNLMLRHLGSDHIIQGACVPNDFKSLIMGGYDRNIIEAMDAVYNKFRHFMGKSGSASVPWPYLQSGLPAASSRKVILAPEASVALKEWPKERWTALAKLLRNKGFTPVYLVHQLDEKNFESGALLFKGNFKCVGEFIRDADFVIGIDSFLGHYASAYGVPVVTLYATGASQVWAHLRTKGSISIDPVAERGVALSRKSYRMKGLDDVSAEMVFDRITPLLDYFNEVDD